MEDELAALKKEVEKLKGDISPVLANFKTVYELNKELFRAEFSRITQHIMESRNLISIQIKKIDETLYEVEELEKLRPAAALDKAISQLHKDHSTLNTQNDSFQMVLEYIKNLDKKMRVIEK